MRNRFVTAELRGKRLWNWQLDVTAAALGPKSALGLDSRRSEQALGVQAACPLAG